MIKRKIIETVKEYDKDGILACETITETEEEDDDNQAKGYMYIPVSADSVSIDSLLAIDESDMN